MNIEQFKKMCDINILGQTTKQNVIILALNDLSK